MAMAGAGCEIRIGQDLVNPSNLNKWLTDESGFNLDGSVSLKSLERLGGLSQSHETDINKSKQKLKSTVEIAIQDKDGHWYAMKGFSSSNFNVYDPRSLKTTVGNGEFNQASIYFGRKCGGPTIVQ